MSDLRSHLLAIREQYAELTPKRVVQVAAEETHPLHDRFEWDDTVAGPKYREHQAATLIRSVRVRYAEADGDEEREVRAFLAVPREDSPRSNYVPVEEVAGDPFARKLVLRQAEREWRQMRRKYAHLDEFMHIVRKDVIADDGPTAATG